MQIARELSNICPHVILVIIVETFALVPNSYLLRYVEFSLVFVETDGMHQHLGTTVVFKC